MVKKPAHHLNKFLEPFPARVQQTTLWLRDFVLKTCPDSNELVYDNHNALAIGYGLSDKAGDVFCSLAVYSKHVNFGFLRGTEITDPEKRLIGAGKWYRYITVTDTADFPKAYMKKLLLESAINAQARLKTGKQELKGKSITKAVAAKKRRPG